ncbi:MAG: hypothetical protein U5K72_05575 [Balneolaceae bacterium]|nr:hypothetical protein [Balneolaceae bacterium]
MKKIIFPFLLFLVFYSGCSENPSESDPEPVDEISGVYFVHGEQVNLTYDFPWPSWGGDIVILSRDTIETSFTLEIKLVENRPDTIRFFGLHGANDGKKGALPWTCDEFTPFDCAFANLTGSEFVVDISSPLGTYDAMGKLENGEITLDAHFEYRGIGIDYSLKGVKVQP